MNLDENFLHLEVLSKIKEGDKISIKLIPGEKKMFVDQSSLSSSLRRWYNGYNREESVKFIEDLVSSIDNNSLYIINGNHIEEGEILINSIKKGLIGLENLKKTYVDDSIISSKINLIIDKLNSIIKNLLNFNTSTLNTINEIEELENNS
tara:strand:- start:3289 stop:3738 length:450 start_codon:yes stop_codon:yes gene_type:complete